MLSPTASSRDLETVPSCESLQTGASDDYRPSEEGTLSKFAAECKHAFKSTNGMLTALCYVFMLTFVVFPGLSMAASSLSFLHGKNNELAWLSLVLLSIFNVMDTLGRYLAGFKCLSISRDKTLCLSYSRTLQLGLFFLSAFEVGPFWLFPSDAFKLVNFAFFALSNGYLSSLCSIGAPEAVLSRVERGRIGAFIGVAKLFGILIGSTLAVPLKEVIQMTPSYSS